MDNVVIQAQASAQTPPIKRRRVLQENIFQGLAGALFVFPLIYLVPAFMPHTDAPGPEVFLSILALPILIIIAAVKYTRLPLWRATQVFVTVLAADISYLFLWVSHQIVGRFGNGTEVEEYASNYTYGGLICSALLLIGMLFSIDSRKRFLYRGRVFALIAFGAALISICVAYLFRLQHHVAAQLVIIFMLLPCALHVSAILTTRRADPATEVHDKERSDTA